VSRRGAYDSDPDTMHGGTSQESSAEDGVRWTSLLQMQAGYAVYIDPIVEKPKSLNVVVKKTDLG